MREIKFRGKRLDNGEWVYGYYYTQIITHAGNRKSRDHFMRTEQNIRYEVDPDTVGQYTGLKDKNGTEIYEGDKVEVYEPDGEVIDWGQVIYGVDCNDKNAYPYHLTCKGYADNYNMYDECEYVVIGNIYDNPELIKVEQ